MTDRWQYDPEQRRYFDTAAGLWLTRAALKEGRSSFLARMEAEAARLAQRLTGGSLSPSGWEAEMQGLLVTSYLALGLAGRGGIMSMTPQDVAPIAAAVQHQFDYLGKFKAENERELPSEAALAARSALYIRSATQAYERGQAAAFDGLDLPEYPGDGSQECLGNCRCEWQIEADEGEFRATWFLGADDNNCESCLENAQQWNPLVAPR
jgi:hypothetical protein